MFRKFVRFLYIDLVTNSLLNKYWYPRKLPVADVGNTVTLDFLSLKFKKSDFFHYAEFGAYKGDTAIKVANYFPNSTLSIFDYSDRINEMSIRFQTISNKVSFFSNSYKLLDSYNYTLAKKIAIDPKFKLDYCFIDGAHTFAIDGLTFFLCDSILNVGGYLDFDDYDWNISTSSMKHSKTMKKLFTQEQMQDFQVKFIIDNFIKSNSRYREIVPNRIFQKIA